MLEAEKCVQVSRTLPLRPDEPKCLSQHVASVRPISADRVEKLPHDCIATAAALGALPKGDFPNKSIDFD